MQYMSCEQKELLQSYNTFNEYDRVVSGGAPLARVSAATFKPHDAITNRIRRGERRGTFSFRHQTLITAISLKRDISAFCKDKNPVIVLLELNSVTATLSHAYSGPPLCRPGGRATRGSCLNGSKILRARFNIWWGRLKPEWVEDVGAD